MADHRRQSGFHPHSGELRSHSGETAVDSSGQSSAHPRPLELTLNRVSGAALREARGRGRDQEMEFLKGQATVLRQELEAIDNRLRELKSNEKSD